jgi:tetratricopeptide (TPR) repeat protein
MEITPLFAVDAEELLDQGKVQEAIGLCLKGLEVYPGYPAGEAVLAKCYKFSGDTEKANEILEEAIQKNPFNKALDTLKKFNLDYSNIEKLPPRKPKKEANNNLKTINPQVQNVKVDIFDSVDDNTKSEEIYSEILNKFSSENNNLQLNESDDNSSSEEIVFDYLDLDLIPGLNDNYSTLNVKFNKVEFLNLSMTNFPLVFNETHQISILNHKIDEYSKLAENLKFAKIKLKEDDFPEIIGEELKFDEIATETMANLFREQGRFNEAIKQYKNLIIKYPEKEIQFKEIIELIEKDKFEELEIKNKKEIE